MTSYVIGLAPLPPCDARRVSAALESARGILRSSRDVLATTPDSVTHKQWARAMTALLERMAEMQALIWASRRATILGCEAMAIEGNCCDECDS